MSVRLKTAFILATSSLASKGLPFHRIVVSSVLRTRKDIERLRTQNVNASENSCHQYGTTFDINYNKYIDEGYKVIPLGEEGLVDQVMEDFYDKG